MLQLLGTRFLGRFATIVESKRKNKLFSCRFIHIVFEVSSCFVFAILLSFKQQTLKTEMNVLSRENQKIYVANLSNENEKKKNTEQLRTEK